MAPDVLAEESHDIIGTSCEIIPGEWYKVCFTEKDLMCFPPYGNVDGYVVLCQMNMNIPLIS